MLPRLVVVTAVLALLLAASSSAFAADEPSDDARTAARQLMDTGHARFEAGDYGAALAAYGEADRLMQVPTTALGVARALVALGRLVEGREALARLLRMPVREGEPPAFERARERARELAAELVQRIPTLALALPWDAPEKLRIVLDGELLSRGAFVSARQVDPGKHVVAVEAEGYARFGAEVTVAERERANVSVILERAPGARARRSAGEHGVASESAGPRSFQEANENAPPSDASERTPGKASGARGLSFAAVGVGAAGLVAGAIAGGLTFRKVGELDAVCPQRACPESARELHASMTASATVADVALPLGAALLGVGVVGLVVTRPSPEPSRSVGLRFAPMGLALEGSF